MRFFFIVQGEGRGHMTQAMALASMLRKHGHEVVRVVVGKSNRRSLPAFFLEGIFCKVDQISSPNFVTDRKNKSVHIGRSILHGLLNLGIYRKSIQQLDVMVKADAPDVIINFYDFIGGLYNKLKSPKARFICIAHQYLAGHSAFIFPKGRLLDRRSLLIGNWLTSLSADNRLALSFSEYPNEKGIIVVPPLLREVFKSIEPKTRDFLLVYMLNHGYADEVNDFHKKHPEVTLHCFWDKPDVPTELKIDDSLTYHQLDGVKFLQFMTECKGYLSTAGFESVCEAMYLGKPVIMMPVKGHYEQACNALDAARAGAGIVSDTYDLKKLVDYIPLHHPIGAPFHIWCDRAEAIFLANLTGR